MLGTLRSSWSLSSRWSRWSRWLRAEAGQTTAEYALVILGAAAVATLLLTWATHSHAVGKLFDEVVDKVLP